MIHREIATVRTNTQIAEGIFLTTFHAPRITSGTLPGQFILLAPLADDSLLNRPMAIYDADQATGALTIGYHVIGPNTEKYSILKSGESIALTGPLGTQFLFDLTSDQYILVGGGIGITSLHLIGKYLASQKKNITTLMGARNKDLIACVDDFKKLGEVRVATDDGSMGHKGYINGLLDAELQQSPENTQVIYCGPHAMMEACAKVCGQHRVSHLAVMEEMMACGVGICVACVCQTAKGQKKVCLDGPIFDGADVQWTKDQVSNMHE